MIVFILLIVIWMIPAYQGILSLLHFRAFECSSTMRGGRGYPSLWKPVRHWTNLYAKFEFNWERPPAAYLEILESKGMRSLSGSSLTRRFSWSLSTRSLELKWKPTFRSLTWHISIGICDCVWFLHKDFDEFILV